MMKKQGFTLVEIMIVVAIIGLLAAIAIPNFVKNREKSQQNGCIENLSQIKGAKDTWALDAKKTTGAAAVTASINEYLDGSTTPSCPAGGVYTYKVVGSNPTCNVAGHAL